jgi:hypothetical protein
MNGGHPIRDAKWLDEMFKPPFTKDGSPTNVSKFLPLKSRSDVMSFDRIAVDVGMLWYID